MNKQYYLAFTFLRKADTIDKIIPPAKIVPITVCPMYMRNPEKNIPKTTIIKEKIIPNLLICLIPLSVSSAIFNFLAKA